MSDNPIITLQRKLAAAGFDPGPIDGAWGLRTEHALDLALGLSGKRSLAWGMKVSSTFRARVFEICDKLGLNPDFLMACMAWESGETFSPKITNKAGSGAIGLIQFMPMVARGLNTSPEALAAMTAEQQLDVVERYFRPYAHKLVTLSDHYMAILWPAAIGKPESSALWDKHASPNTFRLNAGLDINLDGVITKAEAAFKVQEKLQKGMKPGNLYTPPEVQ